MADEATQEQRINRLLDTLKSGMLEDQRKAAHGLWDAIHYRGIGTLSAKEVVGQLTEAMRHKDDYVRSYVRDALVSVRHEAAMPIYLKWLDDPSPSMRSFGATGLGKLGPKAKEAIPILSAKIKEGKVFAFDALALIAGKDAVPVVLEVIAKYELDQDATFSAERVFAEYPDPRAAKFMGERFDYGSVHAVLYFAALADEPALERMRKCLTRFPTDPKAGPLSPQSHDAVSARVIAAQTLGKKKDKESFDAILKMVTSDPSIRVRTAAATAMGEYADAKAVPALVKALSEQDAGFAAQGHTDGDLRRAAARSLGRIGDDSALAALYAGAKGPAKAQCVEFWTSTKEPKHLGAFLKFYDAEPVDANLAAGVISHLLARRKGKQLTGKEQAAAEEAFLKEVDDPARFGPKEDLSEGGKWRIRITYAFHGENFATVEFAFRDSRPNGYSHGHSVLYRKTGGKWKPMGKTIEWVE